MENNWSVSLEHGEYENNLELVVKEAIEAVSQTAKGFYVNVVAPEALLLFFGNKVYTQFIVQYGCGGYVLRVWKNKY
jgi:uncharacterized membrane protein YukC